MQEKEACRIRPVNSTKKIKRNATHKNSINGCLSNITLSPYGIKHVRQPHARVIEFGLTTTVNFFYLLFFFCLFAYIKTGAVGYRMIMLTFPVSGSTN